MARTSPWVFVCIGMLGLWIVIYMYMNKNAITKCAEVKTTPCPKATTSSGNKPGNNNILPAKSQAVENKQEKPSGNIPNLTTFSALATGFYNKSIHERFLQVRNKHIKMRVGRVETTMFPFWHDKNVLQNCKQPCSVDVESETPWDDYDLLIYRQIDCPVLQHHGKATRVNNLLPDDYLRLTGIVHNEATARNGYEACDNVINDHNLPNDITMSYLKRATIWSNYVYNPFSFETITKMDDILLNAKHKAVCVFVSHCKEPRMTMIRDLGMYVPIRSYGQCMHNAETQASKIDELKNCVAYLSFENTFDETSEDYISEKMFEGLSLLTSQTLTIYYGAYNAEHFSPPVPTLGTPEFKLPMQDVQKTYHTTFNTFAFSGNAPLPTEEQVHNNWFIDARLFTNVQMLGTYLRDTVFPNHVEYLKKHFSFVLDAKKMSDLHKFYTYLHDRNVLKSPCKLCSAAADMQLARLILAEMGLKPNGPSAFRVTRREFTRFLATKALQGEAKLDVELLYDIAYGRMFRDGNYLTSWNDPSLHYKE